MSTIDVNDTTLYYERAGTGPAVLFVHGMCGDADVWADQAARLSDRYTCVRYDRRGHSRSRRGSAPVSIEQHASDAAALIEALDLAPCLVVGSSGGAAIALDVALRRAELLRGAVLSEPPLFALDPGAADAAVGEVRTRVQRGLAAGGPRAAIDAFFSFVCPGLWSVLDEAGRERYRRNAETGLAELAAPPLDVAADELASVDVPVLVICGTATLPVFRSVAPRLAAALADARLVELEGSGHVTYVERPDAFAGAVAAFATELDRDVAPEPAAG